MRPLAFCVKFPGPFSVLSFQSLRYSRKSIRNELEPEIRKYNTTQYFIDNSPWGLFSNNERIRMKGHRNLTSLTCNCFRDIFQMFVESYCFKS